MRMGAGAGAGFGVRPLRFLNRQASLTSFKLIQLDDEDDELARDLVRLLRVGADALEAQLAEPEHARFVKRALSASHGYAKWAKDIEHHQNRRTMPVTNSRAATNVIGYRYTSSSSS